MADSDNQTLESWPIDSFIQYERNPRKNDHAVDRVAMAIEQFGFRVPVLATSEGVIVDGHLRLKAAEKLEMESVPVLKCDDMTDEQIKAFRLSVNKMAELADWDNELLSSEIQDLENMDFDVTTLGFSDSELQELQSSIEDSLNDGFNDADEEEIEEADTSGRIGPYIFDIPRQDYVNWLEELRQEVGFEKENVIAEIKKRLGL